MVEVGISSLEIQNDLLEATVSDSWFIAWEEEYERKRQIRLEKFWNEFSQKHFNIDWY